MVCGEMQEITLHALEFGIICKSLRTLFRINVTLKLRNRSGLKCVSCVIRQCEHWTVEAHLSKP